MKENAARKVSPGAGERGLGGRLRGRRPGGSTDGDDRGFSTGQMEKIAACPAAGVSSRLPHRNASQCKTAGRPVEKSCEPTGATMMRSVKGCDSSREDNGIGCGRTLIHAHVHFQRVIVNGIWVSTTHILTGEYGPRNHHHGKCRRES
jgi:hypothetical protein